MFDLKEQIKKWRSLLEGDESYKNTDIEELESHVVEEIEQLKDNGLNEEEGFWVATHRIGKSEDLNLEFKKVNSIFIWKKRLLLFLGGFLFFTIMPQIFKIFTYRLFSINLDQNNFPSIEYSFFQILGVSLMVYLIFSNRAAIFITRWFERLKNRKFTKFIIYGLILLGSISPVLGSWTYFSSGLMIFPFAFFASGSVWLLALMVSFLFLYLSVNRSKSGTRIVE